MYESIHVSRVSCDVSVWYSLAICVEKSNNSCLVHHRNCRLRFTSDYCHRIRGNGISISTQITRHPSWATETSWKIFHFYQWDKQKSLPKIKISKKFDLSLTCWLIGYKRDKPDDKSYAKRKFHESIFQKIRLCQAHDTTHQPYFILHDIQNS